MLPVHGPLRRVTIYPPIYAALPADRPPVWTLAERQRLGEQRQRWQGGRDRFTPAEIRSLCFCAWLVARGRMRR